MNTNRAAQRQKWFHSTLDVAVRIVEVPTVSAVYIDREHKMMSVHGHHLLNVRKQPPSGPIGFQGIIGVICAIVFTQAGDSRNGIDFFTFENGPSSRLKEDTIP